MPESYPTSLIPPPAIRPGCGWIARGYLGSLVVLLLLTATVKFVSSFGRVSLLTSPDPILPWLSVRAVLLVATGLELLTAVALLSARTLVFKLACLVLLGFIFLAYKAALLVFGIPKPCPCLGSLGAWLGVSDALIGVAGNCILFYLFIPSFLGFIRLTGAADRWNELP